MKFLAWLNFSGSDAFAFEIAEEFARNYPPHGTFRSSKEAEQRLSHAIEVIGNRAFKFHRQSPMGWYRKARFMNVMKRRLFETGHNEELIDRVLYAVVLRTARKGLQRERF